MCVCVERIHRIQWKSSAWNLQLNRSNGGMEFCSELDTSDRAIEILNENEHMHTQIMHSGNKCLNKE